jgi:hypothetical protein
VRPVISHSAFLLMLCLGSSLSSADTSSGSGPQIIRVGLVGCNATTNLLQAACGSTVIIIDPSLSRSYHCELGMQVIWTQTGAQPWPYSIQSVTFTNKQCLYAPLNVSIGGSPVGLVEDVHSGTDNTLSHLNAVVWFYDSAKQAVTACFVSPSAYIPGCAALDVAPAP